MITAHCKGCSRRYNVKAANQGRRFRCKSCGEIVTVPKLPSPKRRPPQKRKRSEAKTSKEDDDLALAASLSTRSVIPRPRSRSGDSTSRRRSSDVHTREENRERRMRLNIGGKSIAAAVLAIPWTAFVLWRVGAAFAAERGLAAPGLGELLSEFASSQLQLVIVVGGLFLAQYANFRIVITAFQEGTGYGLCCLFVPGYALIFLLTHLRETWLDFVLIFIGLIVFVLGLAWPALPILFQVLTQ